MLVHKNSQFIISLAVGCLIQWFRHNHKRFRSYRCHARGHFVGNKQCKYLDLRGKVDTPPWLLLYLLYRWKNKSYSCKICKIFAHTLINIPSSVRGVPSPNDTNAKRILAKITKVLKFIVQTVNCLSRYWQYCKLSRYLYRSQTFKNLF